MSSRSLSQLKTDLVLQAKKGVGFLWAGGTYWLIMTGIGSVFAPETAALLIILGMGIVFPLAFVFSRWVDATVVTSDHPLSLLGGQIGALNGLFLPVMIVVYVHIPMWTPFTVGALAGAHFLPYGWLYDSRGYVVLSLGLSLGSTVAAFALAQYSALDHSFVVIPVLGVFAHGLSSGMVWKEVRTLQESAGDPSGSPSSHRSRS